MKRLLIFMATILGAAGSCTPSRDVVPNVDDYENSLTVNFFGHGSIGFEYDGDFFYVDPVSDYADYASLPKADFIFVTHEHGDHLDAKAIEALTKEGTKIYLNPTAHDALGRGEVLEWGERADFNKDIIWDGVDEEGNPTGGVQVEGWIAEAVPAYNVSPAQLGFHPREGKHNGYVFTFGGTRVYVAGDTEPTPEMLAMDDIDIAFLPVNQPYTMTEEQAAEATKAIYANYLARHDKLVEDWELSERDRKAIRPEVIFYPYHFGGTDHTTDLRELQKLLDGSGVDVRIRPLE